MSLSIIQVGLGPIGIAMARKAVARGHRIVGAVDSASTLQGRSVADVLGCAALGTVSGSPEDAPHADVALVTTVSDLERVVPTCVPFLRRGTAVVSTCEELIYPWKSLPVASRTLDEAARMGGVACLGTGINPGFVLDYLPVILSAPVEEVRSIHAWRVVDAGKRRGPLQKKVGAGLTPAEFAQRVAAGGFGHRGFMESLHLLCAAFGLDTAGASTFIEPVISDVAITTEHASVAVGSVAGIHQGARDASGRIVLDLKMYVGALNPADIVELDGTPRIRVEVQGGYHGDIATCAIALNAAEKIRSAQPGLRTMLDMPALCAPFVRG
ncbi:MAG: dihydrodipicolinate reductase [Planctomycetes bacterium]|nr:dihydrodipicolinate reductase [Planctomycetota bacterium]